MRFLKFVTVEEVLGKKPKKRNISPLYYTDFFMCLLLFVNFGGLFYKYLQYFVLFALPAALVILMLKPLYDKNSKTPKYLKIIVSILRSLIYAVLMIVMVLPYTMGLDIPWYYPVQRTLFLSNYRDFSVLHDFLPESVPLDAKAYDAQFSPSFGQGSYVHIRFETDAENIQELKTIAENNSAQHCTAADKDAKKWLDAEHTSTDAEVYIFYQSSHSAVYILNERTGFFELYWY